MLLVGKFRGLVNLGCRNTKTGPEDDWEQLSRIVRHSDYDELERDLRHIQEALLIRHQSYDPHGK